MLQQQQLHPARNSTKLTCYDSAKLDNAHGILKQDIQYAVQPALRGEDGSCHCDYHRQVDQSPEGNGHLQAHHGLLAGEGHLDVTQQC